jgi:hypothetical protein
VAIACYLSEANVTPVVLAPLALYVIAPVVLPRAYFAVGTGLKHYVVLPNPLVELVVADVHASHSPVRHSAALHADFLSAFTSGGFCEHSGLPHIFCAANSRTPPEIRVTLNDQIQLEPLELLVQLRSTKDLDIPVLELQTASVLQAGDVLNLTLSNLRA